jgi:hypothetical protein
MKLTINKIRLLKFLRLLKRGKIAAKFAAIGTTITGAVAAFSGSATTGAALSAAGATAYAATSATQGYEKTKHIPPVRVDKTANMLRKHEKEPAREGRQRNAAKTANTAKQPGMRGAASHPPHIPRKK